MQQVYMYEAYVVDDGHSGQFQLESKTVLRVNDLVRSNGGLYEVKYIHYPTTPISLPTLILYPV